MTKQWSFTSRNTGSGDQMKTSNIWWLDVLYQKRTDMTIPHQTQVHFLPQDLYFHLGVQQLGIWNYSNQESEKPVQGKKNNSYSSKERKANFADYWESKEKKESKLHKKGPCLSENCIRCDTITTEKKEWLTLKNSRSLNKKVSFLLPRIGKQAQW